MRNYVPSPEEPEQAPLSPNYVHEPEYLEYLTPSNDEEDLEDPADYLADRGDDDDESSDDDEDDNDVEEDDEEEEHPALADSSSVPVDDHVPSVKDIEAFETDDSAPTPALIAVVVDALPSSSPPSLLTPLSSLLPQTPSPPLHVPSPPTHPIPTYDEAPLGYRAVRIWLSAASPPTHHLSEILSPPLLLPSTSHKDDLPEADMSLLKRARFTTPTFRIEVEENTVAAVTRQPGLDVATMDATS
nr:hypothetical protein [Tanacetum cinerariifolium]